MPKPVRPITKLARNITRAPAAQARVIAAFYAAPLAGGDLAGLP
jgi:hypothetical protein